MNKQASPPQSSDVGSNPTLVKAGIHLPPYANLFHPLDVEGRRGRRLVDHGAKVALENPGNYLTPPKVEVRRSHAGVDPQLVHLIVHSTPALSE